MWPLLQDYLVPALGVLLLIIVGYMIATFVGRMVSAPIRKRVDDNLWRFVGMMVYYSIMISILMAVMGKLGFQVSRFAAILASAGFAIGMAFQGTLGNIAAGIMLMVFRPFKVGDVILAAAVKAKVNEIDLFATTLDTPDNRRIIIPNSAITAGTIENTSHHKHRRVDVSVVCEYSADIRHTRTVLECAAESLQSCLVSGDGRGFQVALGTFGEFSVSWTVRSWTKAENFWPVNEALTEAVKNHLDAAGIRIPFPQLDIHVPNAQDFVSKDKAG